MNEVEAVKTAAEIALISSLLLKHGNQDYADVWNLGINTALRISDLLSIKMSDVKDKSELVLIEGKTRKARTIKLNSKAVEIISRRATHNPSDAFLFQSHSNRAASLNKPLDRSTVARKFKEIGLIVGIQLSTHSMRKTRGAVMYNQGVSIEKICKMLNHSSTAVTLRYIGITQKDISDTYDEFVL